MQTKSIITLAWLFAMSVVGCSNESSTSTDNQPPDQLDQPLEAATSITDAFGNIYTVGYEQVSANNQNPFVEKRSADGNLAWKNFYEESTVDGRTTMIALDDQNQPYVAFTVDGGSNESTYITRHYCQPDAFSSAPFPSYGSGGGPKVTVLARLNASNGQIERATFLIARLTNGNTNTLRPLGILAVDNSLYVDVVSAAWPQAAGATHRANQRFNPDLFNDESRPNLRYQLSADLNEIIGVAVAPK